MHKPRGAQLGSPASQQPLVLPTEANGFNLLLVWSEVCGQRKMPLWVSVYSPVFRYQEAGVSWWEAGGAPDSWLFLKRISEADYSLNPFFHRSSYKLSFLSPLHNSHWEHWQVGWLDKRSSLQWKHSRRNKRFRQYARCHASSYLCEALLRWETGVVWRAQMWRWCILMADRLLSANSHQATGKQANARARKPIRTHTHKHALCIAQVCARKSSSDIVSWRPSTTTLQVKKFIYRENCTPAHSHALSF